MDSSPPGSLVHGILQARIQVWVAMPSDEIFPTQEIIIWVYLNMGHKNAKLEILQATKQAEEEN